MTNITYGDLSGTPGRNFFGRAASALRSGYTGLAVELAACRQDVRRRQSLKRVDWRLLQDIGIDRNAC